MRCNVRKVISLFVVCILVAAFAASTQAAPVPLNEKRLWGVWDSIIVNGESAQRGIGFYTTNEGIDGFVLKHGSNMDWENNVSAADSLLSAGQISAMKRVMAAHDYLVADYTMGPWNNWNEDTHRVKWGTVAHLLILEIFHDGQLSDFAGLLDGNFQAAIANNYLWSNVGSTYEAVVNDFLDVMNSSLIKPDAVEISALYSPAHNIDRHTLLAYGPASPLATPVPAAAWILVTGIAGIAAMRRKNA